MALKNYIVTPSEVHHALQSSQNSTKKIIPVSAAWFLPNDPQQRTGLESFTKCHIPGARFFDIDVIKDRSSPYPHMLPSEKEFARALGTLGISNDDTVVVFDTPELGIFSAPRVGWTFRTFGHEKVHLLDNFKMWVEQGLPVESGQPLEVEAVQYTTPSVASRGQIPGVVDFDAMQHVIDTEAHTDSTRVLDARPKGRYDGTDPEPRPGLPSGHMPNAISMPFQEVLDSTTKTFLPPDRLQAIFRGRKISGNARVISSCGTGVTAAVIDTALERAGYQSREIYDGSWTEWASRQSENIGAIVKT